MFQSLLAVLFFAGGSTSANKKFDASEARLHFDKMEHQVVLAHFLSVPKRQSLVRDLLDGQLWSVVRGLGTSLGSGSLQIRDLGALRALTDLGALELVANLEACTCRSCPHPEWHLNNVLLGERVGP